MITGSVSRVPQALMKWQMFKLENEISCFQCDFPALLSVMCALSCFSIAGSCGGSCCGIDPCINIFKGDRNIYMQYPLLGPSETNTSQMLIAGDVCLLGFHLLRKLSQFANERFPSE